MLLEQCRFIISYYLSFRYDFQICLLVTPCHYSYLCTLLASTEKLVCWLNNRKILVQSLYQGYIWEDQDLLFIYLFIFFLPIWNFYALWKCLLKYGMVIFWPEVLEGIYMSEGNLNCCLLELRSKSIDMNFSCMLQEKAWTKKFLLSDS